MGTRSIIAKENKDGSVKAVYCHWDGYPSNNGKLLLENYNKASRINSLLRGGDISSLSESCDKPEGHTFENRTDGFTTYYGRDRGEKDCEMKVLKSVEDLDEMDYGQEYEYLYKNGQWMFRSCEVRDWKELTPEDCKED